MKESYKVTHVSLYKHSGFDLMYRFTYPAVTLSSCSPGAESRKFSVLLSCSLDLTGPGKLGNKLAGVNV